MELLFWLVVFSWLYIRVFLWFVCNGILLGAVIQAFLVVWVALLIWFDGKVDKAMSTWKGRTIEELRQTWNRE